MAENKMIRADFTDYTALVKSVKSGKKSVKSGRKSEGVCHFLAVLEIGLDYATLVKSV